MMGNSKQAAVVPKKCLSTHQTNSQLKVAIMLVTLISFYYHACYLIVSCSLLNGNVMVSAANQNYGRVRKIVFHPQSYSSHNPSYSAHHHNDNQREHQQQHDVDHQHFKQQPPQANDIFTKQTHSQGRIDDDYNDNYLHESKDNSVASDGGNFHADDISKNFARGSTGDINLQPKSSKQALVNEKRYAFSTPKTTPEMTDDADATKMSQSKPVKQTNFMDVGCKDELGNYVDWFIAYKLPQIPTSQDPLLVQGSKYYFLTAKEASSWKESKYPIHSIESILAATLQVLWTNESASNIARVAYNDQPPDQPAVVMNGHTKGLAWTSLNGGVWLQHSCPHFPDLTSHDFSSSYPTGGLINGQMFLCMSLENVSSVDVLGSILQYTKPFIFNYSIPTPFHDKLPQLMKVVEQNFTIRTAPWYNTYQLKAGSLQLKVYAKGPKFRREIYSTWIAPDYATGLDVQSWLNGQHPFMSNCTSTKNPVLNVLMKKMSSQNFSNTDDHSKWAVSTDKDKPVVCVGDLNRMKPQKTRGGVAICITNPQVHLAFQSLVQEVQPCNSKSFKHFSIGKSRHVMENVYIK